MDMKKIGSTIRYLRNKAGYTQQDIADLLGISFQAVSKWERGLCVPDAAYLSKLAGYLDVELEDLLEGNISYLDDKWKGLLILPEDICLTAGTKPLLHIIISYFMLAGIREITIQTTFKNQEQVAKSISELKNYGVEIKLTTPYQPGEWGKSNIMVIERPVFLYGTNLTKYFWKAMDRKNGVSVLTMEQDECVSKYSVEYNNQRLVCGTKTGKHQMLPIVFYPSGYIKHYRYNEVFRSGVPNCVENGVLYAEPTARGLIVKEIVTQSDCDDVVSFINLLEKITNEKVYDVQEIALRRKIKASNDV